MFNLLYNIDIVYLYVLEFLFFPDMPMEHLKLHYIRSTKPVPNTNTKSIA